MGDEIGGHHVSGHVHTTATIERLERTEDNRRFTFKVQPINKTYYACAWVDHPFFGFAALMMLKLLRKNTSSTLQKLVLDHEQVQHCCRCLNSG